jgi:hypothetical protein
MSVLIDSSVWIEHFRAANTDLIELLARDIAMARPMVLGETTESDMTIDRVFSSVDYLQPADGEPNSKKSAECPPCAGPICFSS